LNFFGRAAYQHQLRAWLEHFPPQQLLVISAERFFLEPRQALEQVEDFLGLSPHVYADELLGRKWKGPDQEQPVGGARLGGNGSDDECVRNPPLAIVEGMRRFNLSYAEFFRYVKETGVPHFL
jgi:hypothetical protein